MEVTPCGLQGWVRRGDTVNDSWSFESWCEKTDYASGSCHDVRKPRPCAEAICWHAGLQLGSPVVCILSTEAPRITEHTRHPHCAQPKSLIHRIHAHNKMPHSTTSYGSLFHSNSIWVKESWGRSHPDRDKVTCPEATGPMCSEKSRRKS